MPEIVSVLVEQIERIATIGAACIGAWAARTGVNTWRDQLRGKENYNLARKVLRAAFRVRDAISNFRHPFMFAPEKQEDAKKYPPIGTSETPDSETAAFMVRWDAVQNALTEFEALLVETEVLWGDTAREASNELIGCVTDLRKNLIRFLMDRSNPHGFSELSPEDSKTIQAVLFAHTTDDPFTRQITESLRLVENVCKEHLV